jgi:uncharacterized protein YggE
MLRRALVFLSVVSLGFGQVTSSSTSVTVTSTLGQNLPPDQVVFGVTIETDLNTTLDGLMAALKGSPLTPATFASVSSRQLSASTLLDWEFQITVPLAGLKSETAVLKALQASLSPLSLTYSVQSVQTSRQALVQACALPDLVSDARTKAQQLAVGANLKLGSVAALTASVTTMIGPSATTPYVIPACSLTATFGQVAAKTLTVYASRTVNVSPDQATVSASVSTPLDGTVDDAVAALAGTGVTSADLQYVNPLYGQNGIAWQFSWTVPFSKLNDEVAALQKAQSKSGTVSFSLNGAQASAGLVAAQDCTSTALVTDAQAYARLVTAAAGVSLNGIVAVSDGNSNSRLGDFVVTANYNFLTVSGYISSILASPQGSCAAAVQFGIN